MQKSITARTQTQKTAAIYGHVLGAVVVLALVSFPALPNLAEQLKMDGGSKRVIQGKSSKSSRHTSGSSGNSESKVAGTSESESHRPLEFYTKKVRDSMFSAPQPPPPPKEKPTPVITPPQPPKPAYISPVAPVVVNPFADHDIVMRRLVEAPGHLEGVVVRPCAAGGDLGLGRDFHCSAKTQRRRRGGHVGLAQGPFLRSAGDGVFAMVVDETKGAAVVGEGERDALGLQAVGLQRECLAGNAGGARGGCLAHRRRQKRQR